MVRFNRVKRWFDRGLTIINAARRKLVEVTHSAQPTSNTSLLEVVVTEKELAEQIEAVLIGRHLAHWFPRSVDRKGGFHERFEQPWCHTVTGFNTPKSIVAQSRVLWGVSYVACHRAQLRSEYEGYARHALRFLQERLWDPVHGGFFWCAPGKRLPSNIRLNKHLYAQVSALYALAMACHTNRDERTITMLKETFFWLEKFAHDDLHGGYFEVLTRDGKPLILPLHQDDAAVDELGTPIGQKSSNAHIHVMEALALVYRIWPDKLVKTRLRETITLVRNKMIGTKLYLTDYFTGDWQDQFQNRSFGHDLEVAYLLVEAADALGELDEGIWRLAKSVVDQAIHEGWDTKHGGFYFRLRARQYENAVKKSWWTQMEGMNALLLMHEHYGSGKVDYFAYFRATWEFVVNNHLDHRFGGFYTMLSRDGRAVLDSRKGHPWKSVYHDTRSLIFAVNKLRGEPVTI